MRTISNILLPIHFTRYSIDLLEYAILFSRAVRAKLHLLHVIPNASGLQSFLELDEFYHTILGNASEPVQEALDQMDLIKVHIRGHEPLEEMMRYIRENAIDLVIVPAHSPDSTTDAPMGDVTRQLVETAPCPVLVGHLPRSRRHHQSQAELTLQELKKQILSNR